MPSPAVMQPPVRNEMGSGLISEKAFAGATTLAAKLLALANAPMLSGTMTSMGPGRKSVSNWKHTAALSGLILAVTMISYAPAYQAGLIWDDRSLVFDNATMNSPDALAKFWLGRDVTDYYPLTWTSLWIDRQLFGDDPLGFHFTNVLLHALAAIMAWRVLVLLKIPGALVAALAFAVHPVTAASVVWIAERKNTLSMLCLMLCLWSYFRAEGDAPRSRRWYWLSVLLFGLALLAKVSVAMTAPALLVLQWGRRKLNRRTAAGLIPFFLLSLVLGLAGIMMMQQAQGGMSPRPEGFLSRLAAIGWCVWFYLAKTVWPFQLTMVYPRWDVDPVRLSAWVPNGLLLLLGAAGWAGRERWGRHVLTALGCYFFLLLPALGLIEIGIFKYSLVADHLQYLALIVPISVAVAVSWKLLARRPRVAASLATVAIALLAILANRQATSYQDEGMLWERNLCVNPRAWIAHNNLGLMALEGDRTEEAASHLKAALALAPNEPIVLNNVGILLAREKDIAAATKHLRHAVAIWPEYDRAHNNLGLALGRLGESDTAVHHFRQALQISPSFFAARRNLADELFQSKRFGDAIPHYQRILHEFPGDAELCFRLGSSLQIGGQNVQAAVHLSEAVRLSPRSIRNLNSLAWLWATTDLADDEGKERAVDLAERANSLGRNKIPEVLDTLAVAYANVGRFDDAIVTAERGRSLARQDDKPSLAAEFEERLREFRQGRPWRSAAAAETLP